MTWRPGLKTKQLARQVVDHLGRRAQPQHGAEVIVGCEVVDTDPYGTGIVPREIRVALRGQYHVDVMWRGYPPVTVGTVVTVLHSFDGNLYEVLGPGGGEASSPAGHHTTHEDGGSDEIDVSGLSGALADPQDAGSIHGRTISNVAPADGEVLTWVDVTNMWEPIAPSLPAHAIEHQAGGSDEIDVTGLLGILADAQNAGWLQGNPVNSAAPSDGDALVWDGVASEWQPAPFSLPAHASSHESGGGDAIQHNSLSGYVANRHIDHSAVSISAGDGLTGGGDITATRTLAVNTGTGLTISSGAVVLAWSGTPTTIQPDDSASAGTSSYAARVDHRHAIVAAAPGSNSVNLSASTEGTGTSFARADHTHQLDVSISPTWTNTHTFNAGIRIPPGMRVVWRESGVDYGRILVNEDIPRELYIQANTVAIMDLDSYARAIFTQDYIRLSRNTYITSGYGLVVGSTDITPGSGDIYATDDIFAGGGISVGSLAVNPGTGWAYLTSGVLVNSTSTDSFLTIGVVVDQGGSDDCVGVFRSSDVAHGITDYATTSTFGQFLKADADTGGMLIRGFTESTFGLALTGYYTTDDTAKTTSARAPVEVRVVKKSGTGGGAPGSNANIFAVRAYNATRFWVDVEGDVGYDGSAGSYDGYDDLALISAVKNAMAQVIDENYDLLLKLGIVSERDHEGRFMVSHKRMTALTLGAIVQLAARLRTLEAQIGKLLPGAV